MVTPGQISVAGVRRRARRRLALSGLVLGIVALGAVAVIASFSGTLLFAVLVAALAPLAVVWLWQRPVRGVYFLFGAAVVQETQYSATVFSDDIGRYVPFFQDTATWSHVQNLSFSIAEIFMVLVILIWVLKGIAERTWRFKPGTLLPLLGPYMLMVLVAEIHGLSSGGDFKLSLWEVRAQVYMFVSYILACNLLQTRRDVMTVLWILVVGTGIKGVQGTWRYVVTLHGNLNGLESIFPHEQSFFFNVVLVFTAILYLFGGDVRLRRTATAFLPFIVFASLANQRRAAILALGVALAVLALSIFIINPTRRRVIMIWSVVLLVILPPYYLAFSGQDGLIALPAHAVASAFTPSARDALSNEYRVHEDKDIMATMRTSPVIGYGFGKPMLVPYSLANISAIYVFWNIMPHDSILWVWMRMGTIGYALFWLLISGAILQATGLARELREPAAQGLALLVLLTVLQEIIFGYLDLQWVGFRNLITMGVCFALLANLRQWVQIEEGRVPGRRGAVRSGLGDR